ncbi:MAG TPA: DUF3617 family protein [Burkholderiales bacterium]|nr:DUF3617 family protein [Burkholderiales bacterium]
MSKWFVACLAVLLPFAAVSQGAGELWEISTQMNIPGMPAGMGGQTQRICQGDDPERRAAAEKKGQDDCKVTDKKQTATRLQLTMTCKQGTMTIDQQYNAARTEFKGSMRMTSKDGDFVMNTTGRKVGACDVQQANREREQQIAAIQKQAAEATAAGAAAQKQATDTQIKQCADAVESMNFHGLGIYGQCYAKKGDAQCKSILDAMNKTSPEVAKSCNARVAEFCRRYQTQEGFLRTRGDETIAQTCGVSTAAIKAEQCPRAAQSGSLAFLGMFCPVEAKPIAQEHCAGRDYTSKMGGKYSQFCQSYLANADFERPRAPQSQGSAQQPQSTTDQVKQGVSKGFDKLKGLFGR